MKNVLVTGAAGFIGSNFAEYFTAKHPDYNTVILDKLTYAGNMENLKKVMDKITFIQGDICDFDLVTDIFSKYSIDTVIHFAAESHVDNSIKEPFIFTKTNVMGTHTLLEAAKRAWGEGSQNKFMHISTDEVFGTLGENGYFTETTPIAPNSPYSCSKAASDMLVRAYHETYKMNVNITNCSNNYGPYQHNEKLIPHMIKLALEDKELPVYGEGLNVRDWLYVEDHCEAIDLVAHNGKNGERYNVGGHNEKRNIEIVKLILKHLNKPESLIKHVEDRKGHDFRYAIDPTKIKNELGWEPKTKFEDGIIKTIDWYISNPDWLK
ncbi:MAG: dTDP-glucose 4,6-dehydratase [Lachnospiraceae bacterium]|nr:dTDP-glucose 4,6-dehydratase [Lachnospiraceae bacterium]